MRFSHLRTNARTFTCLNKRSKQAANADNVFFAQHAKDANLPTMPHSECEANATPMYLNAAYESDETILTKCYIDAMSANVLKKKRSLIAFRKSNINFWSLIIKQQKKIRKKKRKKKNKIKQFELVRNSYTKHKFIIYRLFQRR